MTEDSVETFGAAALIFLTPSSIMTRIRSTATVNCLENENKNMGFIGNRFPLIHFIGQSPYTGSAPGQDDALGPKLSLYLNEMSQWGYKSSVTLPLFPILFFSSSSFLFPFIT